MGNLYAVSRGWARGALTVGGLVSGVRLLTTKSFFARVEAESRTWFLRCPRGWEISVWDAGGLRYKATRTRKKSLGRRPRCNRMRWFFLCRKT